MGRKLVTLLDEIKKAGSYSLKFDASEYSSGIYFYRIETHDFSDTRKMQLIK
ncbi:MAG: T9SS type A sorting domain-containing protein [Bacteroidota bacterium]|nr:T9SS type A sorting domain-containing protein [Bacteroidota bacterium]